MLGTLSLAPHGHGMGILNCSEECTTDPAADREPVVFDLARYGQRQSRMSVPKLRFDDAWKRSAPRFIQLGRRV
jgi:hypothetical protein